MLNALIRQAEVNTQAKKVLYTLAIPVERILNGKLTHYGGGTWVHRGYGGSAQAERSSQFKPGLSLKVRWKVADKLGRKSEGDDTRLLEVRERLVINVEDGNEHQTDF